MANPEHLEILMQGSRVWNDWRENNLMQPDLSGISLVRANLERVNLSYANLRGASFLHTNLRYSNLSKADLSKAELFKSNLRGANLVGANLSKAQLKWTSLDMANLGSANLTKAIFKDVSLCKADLAQANVRHANLSGTNLRYARLVDINLEGANIEGCSIYGVSVWNAKLKGANQLNLDISRKGEPAISVDNLEVAQFVYLLLNNQKIREVIDTVTSRVVLILGRFTPERKVVLDTLREKLRELGYVPILFDFDKPSSRNLSETVSTLAHLARFVVADITDAKSLPQELQRIVPHLPSLPIQTLLMSSEYEYGMFRDFFDYPWVLPLFKYDSLAHLLDSLEEKVILPAAAKSKQLSERHHHLET